MMMQYDDTMTLEKSQLTPVNWTINDPFDTVTPKYNPNLVGLGLSKPELAAFISEMIEYYTIN